MPIPPVLLVLPGLLHFFDLKPIMTFDCIRLVWIPILVIRFKGVIPVVLDAAGGDVVLFLDWGMA